jgi:aldose sugar dehydrogenase
MTKIYKTMKRASLIVAAFMAMLSTACNQQTTNQMETPVGQTAQDVPKTDCEPVMQSEPNAPDQKPAFKGQTRVCAITSDTNFDVAVITKGLELPWAVEPLPNGDLLITEKPGRLRIVSASGEVGQPITGLPPIDAGGQGGLLDVALSPDFSSDQMIYWSFTEPRTNGNATSVARGKLSADRKKLEKVEIIFKAMPPFNNTMHFGSRLAFGPDGMLYITLGERSDMKIRPQAQHMDSHMGKTIRIMPDGKVPSDNPFVNQKDALPEIWSVGHRNIQSAAFDQEGRYWIVEHGPKGGDEVNLIEKGKNYGWPLVSYGEEYSGEPIATAKTQREGFEQPVYYWDPVIAPSGAEFYTGNAFPEWRGNLFVGGLVVKSLVRLQIENNRVTGEEHLLTDRDQRIRDVRQGPDGALYVVTDQKNGELWKITPRK